MSIHVCKCEHNGRTEYHLRYPGMDKSAAQELADKINGGALSNDWQAARAQPAQVPRLTDEEIVACRKAQVCRYGTVDPTKPYSDSIAYGRAIEAAMIAKLQGTLHENRLATIDSCKTTEKREENDSRTEYTPRAEFMKRLKETYPENQCAQCKKPYKKSIKTEGCPKCAPGVKVAEDEFRKPLHKCPEKLKPGGCQLHNLHCGYPKCDQ